MLLQPTGGLEPLKLVELTKKNHETIGNEHKSKVNGFSSAVNMLSDSVNSVNKSQINAETAIEKLATGEAGNLHNTMIAIQEANLTFQFAVKTRNKIVEAYQEVMRMQI